MAIEKETLKAMIRDFHGFDISDEELDLIKPALDNYLEQVEKLRELDLSSIISSRLLRTNEGG